MTREERIEHAKRFAPKTAVQEREGLAIGELVTVNADMIKLLQEDMESWRSRAKAAEAKRAAQPSLPVEAAGPMTTEYLKANRDLPMALWFVRQYSDEVWRLCQLGHLNSRSKLADITLDARAFLDDLSDKLEVPAPPADTAHAAVTKVTEWDGAYFCGACNELLVLDQQPYCHKCGTQLACDHGIGHTDYCAPCGRTVSE